MRRIDVECGDMSPLLQGKTHHADQNAVMPAHSKLQHAHV